MATECVLGDTLEQHFERIIDRAHATKRVPGAIDWSWTIAYVHWLQMEIEEARRIDHDA